jgi:hypothetical protein
MQMKEAVNLGELYRRLCWKFADAGREGIHDSHDRA